MVRLTYVYMYTKSSALSTARSCLGDGFEAVPASQ